MDGGDWRPDAPSGTHLFRMAITKVIQEHTNPRLLISMLLA